MVGELTKTELYTPHKHTQREREREKERKREREKERDKNTYVYYYYCLRETKNCLKMYEIATFLFLKSNSNHTYI